MAFRMTGPRRIAQVEGCTVTSSLAERWRRWRRSRRLRARRAIPIMPGSPWSFYEAWIKVETDRRLRLRRYWRAALWRDGAPLRRAMRGGIDWPGTDA